MARSDLVSPHRDEHDKSLERRMSGGVMPKGLQPLLEWFLRTWAEEVPVRLHTSGQERQRPGHIVRGNLEVIDDPGGGDRTGAPRIADEWRRYVENSDKETDVDGSFVRPMHAALTMLAGRSRDGSYPFMARFLTAVALANGDFEFVCRNYGIRREISSVYTEEALRRLWIRYDTRVRERIVA